MIKLDEFRSHLTERRPEVEAWGRFVRETVEAQIDRGQVSLQIVSCRAKEIDSAVGKIARKNYDNPLEQMTDLVGVRFVVLVSPQIDPIASIIESCPAWIASLDRDAEQEKAAAPENFVYQSMHYVVRNKGDFEFDGVLIKAKLPCEIQVRTIMQHAYAEMTHDSIYKQTAGKIPAQARRFMASSMALIETADHLFCETMRLLDDANKPRNQLWKGLTALYASKLGDSGMGYDEKLNLTVLDSLDTYQTDSTMAEIEQLFQNRVTLLAKIRSRINNDPFWSQPTALFAYWLVTKDGAHALDAWPYASAHDALNLIYSDLGKSPPRH